MSRTLLLFGLYGLGISAMLIGCAMALFGPHAVGTFFNTGLGLETLAGPVTDLASANVDSEMRFYALMFVFYGGVLVQTAKDVDTHFKRVPLLLSIFFLAGSARSLGYVFTGKPHLLFIILMCVELGLPLFLLICWRLQKRSSMKL